jgi:IS30 family transposase
LGRAASTLSRELRRNGGRDRYRAATSDRRAWDRALRPKPCKLASNEPLRLIVASKLEGNWSPEQIAGWLKRAYPDDEAYRVSHETIYRSLFVQARGVLKKELQAHLRSQRAIRRSRHATGKGDQRGSIVDAVSIRERPSSVEDRAVPGHWEGDLLCGSSNSHIVTLVERHSRYVMLAKVPNRESRSVVTALIEHTQSLPGELCRSLTWDRGKEMAEHKRFTMATDVAVYFCDPQSPWQRGSNENTNGLLRQYFPKGTDLSRHTARDLRAVAHALNTRPRKTLGWKTPVEVLERFLIEHNKPTVATTG